MYAIETFNLTKKFGKYKGIVDINIRVSKGEIYGFVGPNGSGKSTTIKTLLNFIFPTSGSGTILGLDIINSSKNIKKHIGYVPSDVNFYETIKVRDMIEYSKGFYDNVDEKNLKYICNELEIELDKKIGSLSFGNKKKVAIVLALIHSPELLILDEPTNGLDPLMQKNLFKLLLREKEKGNTVFLSSHNLVEVETLCDEVAVIKNGKIVDVVRMESNKGEHTLIVRIKGNIEENDIRKVSSEVKCLKENEYKFKYLGETDKLLKYLSRFNIEDIIIERERLEDSFFRYYKRDGVNG